MKLRELDFEVLPGEPLKLRVRAFGQGAIIEVTEDEILALAEWLIASVRRFGAEKPR